MPDLIDDVINLIYKDYFYNCESSNKLFLINKQFNRIMQEEFLSSLLSYFPVHISSISSIISLNMRGFKGPIDIQVFSHLYNLEYLDITLTKFEHNPLKWLNGDKLRYLNISSSSLLNDNDISEVKKFKNLKWFIMEMCENKARNQTLKDIFSNCTSLTKLELNNSLISEWQLDKAMEKTNSIILE